MLKRFKRFIEWANSWEVLVYLFLMAVLFIKMFFVYRGMGAVEQQGIHDMKSQADLYRHLMGMIAGVSAVAVIMACIKVILNIPNQNQIKGETETWEN